MNRDYQSTCPVNCWVCVSLCVDGGEIRRFNSRTIDLITRFRRSIVYCGDDSDGIMVGCFAILFCIIFILRPAQNRVNFIRLFVCIINYSRIDWSLSRIPFYVYACIYTGRFFCNVNNLTAVKI